MANQFSVIGNWKMHGTIPHAASFINELITQVNAAQGDCCHIAICPPDILIPHFQASLKGNSSIRIGAQNVSEHESGAYTGQVSGAMLVEHGCHYVIVGHSERRAYNHETDPMIAAKFFAAQSKGLTPILCVGETKAQREAGSTNEIIMSQLACIFEQRGAESFRGAVIAYEPVWAIGTGLSATPEQAEDVHHLLRQTLAKYDTELAQSIPIIYGGSVKPSTAQALFSMPNINGALVGGASLSISDFWGICMAANSLMHKGK